MSNDLHARITMILAQHLANERYCLKDTVDAIIKELDMGIPCATTGCRMRQIARRHDELSRKVNPGVAENIDNALKALDPNKE
jgi:hypothetical protein